MSKLAPLRYGESGPIMQTFCDNVQPRLSIGTYLRYFVKVVCNAEEIFRTKFRMITVHVPQASYKRLCG